MADVKSEDESSMCISDMNILKTRASEFTSSQASPQSAKKREQIKRRNQSSNAMNIMTLDSPNAWSALNSNCPVAESVHSALVSAVSKAEMTDLTESLAPKSIQRAFPTEWNFCWQKDFSLTVNLLFDTWCY